MQTRLIRQGYDMKHSILIIAILASLCLPASAQDERLGRLFTTPAERARLDVARKQGGFPEAEANGQESSDQGPELATLDGYVVRNNGKMTTWVNQVPTQETDHNNSLRVSQKPNHAPVISVRTESGKRVKVNVGETVDLQTGAVRNILETPN
jgi:hypothetical protein